MGTTPFVILLPPSEGKDSGGTASKPWSCESGVFGDALGQYRCDVAAQLRALKGGDQKLLGVKGVHLEHAQYQNRQLVGSPSLPAWQRYTGVVWDHLNLGSMPTPQRTAATKRIFIPSGMAGVVRATDALPDYRLKMGARLAPFGLMSTWWRDDLTDAFVSVIKKTPVVDLLPQEHKAAFSWQAIPNVIHIDLVSKTGAIVGGHNAKAAKGLLARHLLDCGNASLSHMLTTFQHSEYVAKESQ